MNRAKGVLMVLLSRILIVAGLDVLVLTSFLGKIFNNDALVGGFSIGGDFTNGYKSNCVGA
jgi:hypothetical protein